MSELVAFILTHGRPDNIKTIPTLRRHGYTGPIHLIIDDQDARAAEYFELDFPVHQFNKEQLASQTDCGDNFGQMATITHARNASYQIAKEIGVRYWIQLDDDYTRFEWRFYEFGNPQPIWNLDKVWESMLTFYKQTPTTTIAMAQGGDYIGGKDNAGAKRQTLKRKAMNSFICSNDRPLKFVGTFNEDVNTYVTLGARGVLFFTNPFVNLVQTTTQSQKGGITELYLNFGTYVKAFTTVTMAPSCVRISTVGDKRPRIHHHILWNYAVPKIVSQSLKKRK